jgi:hypothetical protein
MELRKPTAIPTDEDYSVVASWTDESFEQENGIWNLYQRQSMFHSHDNQLAGSIFKRLSDIARFVEPIVDDQFKPDDPFYRQTHSFRAGMWTGMFMQEGLYDGQISVDDTIKRVAGLMPEKLVFDLDGHEKNDKYLRLIGHVGLELAGSGAREYIDKWSNQMTYANDLRQTYKLGVGAFLATSHGYYSGIYPIIKSRYDMAVEKAQS